MNLYDMITEGPEVRSNTQRDELRQLWKEIVSSRVPPEDGLNHLARVWSSRSIKELLCLLCVLGRGRFGDEVMAGINDLRRAINTALAQQKELVKPTEEESNAQNLTRKLFEAQ